MNLCAIGDLQECVERIHAFNVMTSTRPLLADSEFDCDQPFAKAVTAF
jgi:hypothetical protein